MAINCTKTLLMKINNSEKKSKFSLCFRSAPTTDGSRGEPVYTYFTVGKKKGVVFPQMLSPASVSSEGEGEEEELGLHRGKKGRSRLSRALRAVFFQASLAKKNKKIILHEKIKNAPNYDSSSYQSPLISIEDENNCCVPKNQLMTLQLGSSQSTITSSSSVTSSLFCPSCNSSLTSMSNLSSPSEKQKGFNGISSNSSSKRIDENSNNIQQVNTRRHWYNTSYNINPGLCLLLISLLVLVIWGKICAIFCTSSWLFFAPRRTFTHVKKNHSSANSSESVDIPVVNKN